MTENTETKKEIKILAIESSCDETAAAVVVNLSLIHISEPTRP